MALRKVGVIPFVTHVSFKIIFAFTPTEQAQKGCDPAVHPPQRPAPEEEARIFRAGNCQVQLPSPIAEQSVCALRKEGTSAKKEKQNGRSLLPPPMASAYLKPCLTLSIFSPSSMEQGRALPAASVKPAGLKDQVKIKIQRILLKRFND